METLTLLLGIPALTVVGLALFRRFFGDYLGEKAKNLATREDIGTITRIVEETKQTFAQDLARLSEDLRAQTSLRLLAAEKRLEAHQEVYQLWRLLIDGIHAQDPEQRRELKARCLDFHFKKCLYLDPTVREAFIDAITSFDVHPDLLRAPPVNSNHVAAIQENFRRVERLGKAITDACELPPMAGRATTFNSRAEA